MAKNVVPEAKEALNRFKMEAANDFDVFSHLKTVVCSAENGLFKEFLQFRR